MNGGIVLAHTPDQFEEAVRHAYGARLNGSLRRLDDADLSDPERAAKHLTASGPDVVALGALAPLEQSLELTRVLDRWYPDVSVVWVTRPTSGLWRQALHAGARDILPPDADTDAIVAALDAAMKTAQEHRVAMGARSNTTQVRNPRVITVTSPKGGSGKTVVATNLAVSLAREAPGDVVLVDLDVQFGDVAGVLHLDPVYSLSHAAAVASLDSTALKGLLTPHGSQLLVLCAPAQPQDADDIGGEAVKRIIEQLAALFRFVVIDTGAGLDDLTLLAVEASTDIVVLSSTDVPAVSGLRKELGIFEKLGVKATRHFVLNRADARVGLVADDIEATTGLQIEASVPSSRAVPTSVNRGTPIVEMDPRSAPARSLNAFAHTFLTDRTAHRVSPARFAWRSSR